LERKIITYGHRLKSETQIYSKSTQTQYKDVGSFFSNLSDGNLDGMLKSIGHRTGVTLRIPVDRLYKFGEGVDRNVYDLLTDLGEAGDNLADTLGDIATEGTEWIDDRVGGILSWLEWWDKYMWWVIGGIIAIIILIIIGIVYFIFFREADTDTVYYIQGEKTAEMGERMAPAVAGAVSPVPSGGA
ncbi:MAG: hypothetical protein KAW47_05700, partial [Thermoplasmatales archaeon]|nr:hypothetical protein [Thermoplasmatales archaeon]